MRDVAPDGMGPRCARTVVLKPFGQAVLKVADMRGPVAANGNELIAD